MFKALFLLCFGVFSFAQSSFSNPEPTFEVQRKVVVQLYYADIKRVNQTLGMIYNILKEYPAQTLNVVVVTYGPGMRAIKKDYDKQTLLRIQSLMEYDVEFIGCRNTMESMHWKESDFINDVSFVQAGIVELIERQVEGYIAVNPY
ncbi:hypothetical protein A9Q76_07660 [Arcobacter sp. 31_11_sub10_T18]|nr:hypothetical protein A9Q76_07660 [Arcobacter sp. 31_11_sub10_T18]